MINYLQKTPPTILTTPETPRFQSVAFCFKSSGNFDSPASTKYSSPSPRTLLCSDVISEHSLHIFARKHLQGTSDFLDVAPGHPRRVHKTGLPVSLNLEGHSFAVGGFLRPTGPGANEMY